MRSTDDLVLSTAPNFRDLGGLPVSGGGTVRRGLVFRSEALLTPSVSDAATLAARGIRLVCDLRSESERTKAPNRFWQSEGVERLELDVLGHIPENASPWRLISARPDADGADAAMNAVYAAMPDAAGGALARLLPRIADGDLPLLIHCTAGKDRTGFMSAILLAALGVARADIVADYLASAGRRTPEATEATRALVLERVGLALSEEAMEAMMGVRARYLETSFGVIEQRYGGVGAYLAQAGLSDAVIARVRTRLVG